MLSDQQKFMQRCFDLARLGARHTSPNPMVGAVLVYQNRIIGEGYHTRYGQAHAEVEAVRSVRPEDRHLISKACLYVSLEPCSVHGRTPPCTDLIIREKIQEVVIAHLDHSPGVNGLGVGLLQEQGVLVTEGILSQEGFRLSRPRNVFVTQQRPYVILKYAQTANGFLARSDGQPLWLTNGISKRLVHRWRSQIDAIMVGTNTALWDNPVLNTRLVPGPSPIRIVPDRHLRLPTDLHLFRDDHPTLIYTTETPPDHQFQQTDYIRLETSDFLRKILQDLQERNVQTLMVEGGTQILNWFLEQELWDEARVFHTPHYLSEGLQAPIMKDSPSKTFKLLQDQLQVYYKD